MATRPDPYRSRKQPLEPIRIFMVLQSYGLVRVNSLDSEEVGTQNISAQRDEPDPADRIRTVNVEIAFSKRSSSTVIARLSQL